MAQFEDATPFTVEELLAGMIATTGLDADTVTKWVESMWTPDAIQMHAGVLGGALDPTTGYFRTRAWRAAEFPAANMVAPAHSLARLYAATVSDVDGLRLLAPSTVETMTAVQTGKTTMYGVPAGLDIPADRSFNMSLGFWRACPPLPMQGLPASLLAGHGVSFGSNTAETPVPAAIIVVLVVLALLNLTGRRAGQVLSWIFHPLLVVAGSLIVPAQLFTATFLSASFRDSGDPVLRQVDVPKLVDAAREAMPSWLPVADGAKLVLTTAGSLLVIVLLALPSARVFFRARRRVNPTSTSGMTA